MADVKPERRISLRAERAAVTRGRIVAAARRLFTEHGYGATTLAAIAVEAGVAVQTVYAVFGSKAGILASLLSELVDLPEADGLVGQAIEASEPARSLDLFAASIRRRWEHAGDIVSIFAQAAATDQAIRAGEQQAIGRRRAGIRRVADSLGPSIDAERASTLLAALTLPEIFRELVQVNGWTPDDYEVWLATTLRSQVIGH